MLASLVIESAVGYPAALHARIPHPVVWAGNAISGLERWWNGPQYTSAVRRLLGFVAVTLVAGAAVLAGLGLQWLVGVAVDAVGWAHFAAALVVAVVGTIGLAQRSLFDHVNNVLTSLRAADLVASRERVSLIVGRDTRQLDEAGI